MSLIGLIIDFEKPKIEIFKDSNFYRLKLLLVEDMLSNEITILTKFNRLKLLSA